MFDLNDSTFCGSLQHGLMRWRDCLPGAKLVFMALDMWFSPLDRGTISMPLLGSLCGLKDRQTREHVKFLRSVGLVKTQRRYQETSLFQLVKNHPILRGEYPPSQPPKPQQFGSLAPNSSSLVIRQSSAGIGDSPDLRQSSAELVIKYPTDFTPADHSRIRAAAMREILSIARERAK